MGATFRKATIPDVEAIYQLLNYYAEKGLLLPRSKLSLYENLHAMTVIEDEGEIVGLGALHILWEDMAEIRSLAIHPKAVNQGLGKQLVVHLIAESAKLGLEKVIALTYQVPFFEKLGFEIVQKESLPHKVWKDCMNCSKFPVCDETAMVYMNQVLQPSA
ncbi:N-acetyltransferase [Fodinisporobacter ferrooxydans]|uniref:N-acetyltransferase n=1 Tax=Fodinisporobacter ferrooxydans TaxID=2901836 RepID=A0ABY4CQW2_9BACL|nr:N-acetyltransferase [Alicyclobacillaceae bacterium MYW30-H2]